MFDEEQLRVDDPLRSTPKLLLTPHIGYVTRETYEVFYGENVAAIEAWMQEYPTNVVAG